MQLIAQEGENRSVRAAEALKKRDYTCPECLFPVRARSGVRRKPHFFHLTSNPHCHQHEKSAKHIALQLQIQALLPAGEGELEKRYPHIHRIADLAWEAKGMVFEIQCSPISLEEALKRTEDYAKIGLTVVWILCIPVFNKRFLSAAESALRKKLCFFAKFPPQGPALIYDQFEHIEESRRLYRSAPFPVHLFKPLTIDGSLTFSGALPHRIRLNPHLKDSFHPLPKKPLHTLLLPSLKRTYRSLLTLLLESL